MQAYVSKELGKCIIYLSLMLIIERTIAGDDIPDTHEDLVNLNLEERNSGKIWKSNISIGWECTSMEP
jgi:hypothetical protein